MDFLAKIPSGVYYALFGLIAFAITIFAGLYIVSIWKKVNLKITKDVVILDADNVDNQNDKVVNPVIETKPEVK